MRTNPARRRSASRGIGDGRVHAPPAYKRRSENVAMNRATVLHDRDHVLARTKDVADHDAMVLYDRAAVLRALQTLEAIPQWSSTWSDVLHEQVRTGPEAVLGHGRLARARATSAPAE